jgi:hypothetical protein
MLPGALDDDGVGDRSPLGTVRHAPILTRTGAVRKQNSVTR